MFPKNDKRRLYQLMDMYLRGVIDSETFCDEFYDSYDMELDHEDLSEREQIAFSGLSKIVDRYTWFEEDLLEYPGAFYDDEALKQKVIETVECLK